MQKSKIGNQNALKFGIYSNNILPGESSLKFENDLDSELKVAKIMLRRILSAEKSHNRILASEAKQNTPKGEKPVKPPYDPLHSRKIIRYLRTISRIVEIQDSMKAQENNEEIFSEMRLFGQAAFLSVPRPAGGPGEDDGISKEMREFAAQAFKTIPKPKGVPECLR